MDANIFVDITDNDPKHKSHFSRDFLNYSNIGWLKHFKYSLSKHSEDYYIKLIFIHIFTYRHSDSLSGSAVYNLFHNKIKLLV